LRRDILAKSEIGVMLLARRSGADFNRVVRADANFRLFQNLDVNFAGAKTFLPTVADTPLGDDGYTKSSFNYRSNRLEMRGRLPDNWRTFFCNEMGFVPRQGVNNGELYVSGRFQPNWSCTKAGCERPIRIGRLILRRRKAWSRATLMDRAPVAKMTYLIAFSRFPISGPRSPVRRFSVSTLGLPCTVKPGRETADWKQRPRGGPSSEDRREHPRRPSQLIALEQTVLHHDEAI
jgi:hypothetical protein